MKEARLYWDIIVAVAMQWKMASHTNILFTADFGENNLLGQPWKSNLFSDRINEQLHLYTAIIEQWFQSFKPIFDRARASKERNDIHGASVLMIKYISSRIALPNLDLSCNFDKEDLLPDYMTVVKLARELLDIDNRKHSPRRPIFILTIVLSRDFIWSQRVVVSAL